MNFRLFQTIALYLLITSFYLPALLLAETEPNNTTHTANPLAINAQSSGSLSAGDTIDWWSVIIPADGALFIQTVSNATVEVDLWIYDSIANGLELIAGYEIGNGVDERTHSSKLKAGKYFIRTGRFTGSGSYTIASQFVPSSLSNDSEPNDSIIQAVNLDTNKSATGHIGYFSSGKTDLVDWWKIVLPVDGKLLVNTTSDTSADIDLKLYDQDRLAEIATFDSMPGIHESTHYDNLATGTYYVKVFAASGYGSYSIFNTFIRAAFQSDTEPNNSSEIAATLQPKGQSTGHLGYYSLGANDNTDWYSITIPADGKFEVRTHSDSTLNVDLHLIDSDAVTEVGNPAISIGPDEATHRDNLTAGTYYMKAARYSGYGSYTITSEFIPAALTNDIEPNDSLPIAKPVSPGSVSTGHLGFYSMVKTDTWDYFSFSVPIVWDTLFVRTVSDTIMDIDLTLYDATGANVRGASTTGPRELLVFPAAAAGTYKIKLERFSNFGAYTILVTDIRPDTGQLISRNMLQVNHVAYPLMNALAQNAPNPASGMTIIKYGLLNNGNTRLMLLDPSGRLIRALVDKHQTAGWHEIHFDAGALAKGIYYYRLQSGDYLQTKQLMVR
jgi:hypothetical protein